MAGFCRRTACRSVDRLVRRFDVGHGKVGHGSVGHGTSVKTERGTRRAALLQAWEASTGSMTRT